MMTSTVRLIVLTIAMLGLLGIQAVCENVKKMTSPAHGIDSNQRLLRIEYSSGSQLEQIIKDLNHKPEAWQADTQEVPRLFITDIPPYWCDKKFQELDVMTKKRIFFHFVGPLILHSNELIQKNRDRVTSIIRALRAGAVINLQDQAFLYKIAESYKVAEDKIDLTDHTLQNELLRRVDTVPPSLVLAQAAEESGWGTSRFAVEGNALFGMWTWNSKGITPLKQRSGLGNYKIAIYETLLQSVIAYMHNLNTHHAYKKLRALRAEMRKTGAKVTGWDLASTLIKYSERGQAYVDSLRALIKVNKLQPVDEANLGNGPTILLIPVGEEPNRMSSR